MPIYLITSVCDEGISETSFKVVEAESRIAIAEDILKCPVNWKQYLQHTKLWWDLTTYEYRYGEPRGWSPEELLRQIDTTHVDGDSEYQFRIHELKSIEQMPSAAIPLVIDAKEKAIRFQ